MQFVVQKPSTMWRGRTILLWHRRQDQNIEFSCSWLLAQTVYQSLHTIFLFSNSKVLFNLVTSRPNKPVLDKRLLTPFRRFDLATVGTFLEAIWFRNSLSIQPDGFLAGPVEIKDVGFCAFCSSASSLCLSASKLLSTPYRIVVIAVSIIPSRNPLYHLPVPYSSWCFD